MQLSIRLLGLIAAVVLSSTQATASTEKEPLPTIADKVIHPYSLTTHQSLTTHYPIHSPGASFIKVHFDKFQLSKGGSVTLRSVHGDESITYDSSESGPLFARSINGDSVIVEWKTGEHPDQAQISIDYFMAGNESATLPQPNLAADNSGLFSTCGINERKDVACWIDSHPEKVAWSSAVARLLIDGRSLCTAWRVGPNNHMITNNHCVSTASELKNTEVWFNYQRTTCGGSLDTTVKVMGDQLLSTDYTLDYTLFTVANFEQLGQFSYLGLDNSEPSYGTGIYIPQHGAGNPKELAIESDQNGSGMCQIDIASTNGRGANTDTGYFCDTIGGSSGSPVLASESHKVIALHHFGGCENQGVKISKIWPQVAPFFDNQLPVGKKGGTPPPQDGVIQRGQSITGITLSKGQQKRFILPASERQTAVKISITSGQGDADLYTLSGNPPTKRVFDCRPYQSGSNEQCLAEPNAEDLHIMIDAYSNFSDVTLQVE
ncbi:MULTISPECIES: serine protease [Vibrio]|uniref:serine protease n=1 Tax=Vibrio TaxID=662 RepID=UPI001482C57F|nr:MULTISPECIES: serine protease [Vibrio]MDQ2165988.1 peptidase [Vibrio anguillarum]NNN97392.1 peptidase [Vibrio sp. B4-6]